jgi:hypothetical protein
LEKEIGHWRKRAPDGFLKRIVVGGFSMQDIEVRKYELLNRRRDLDEEKDEVNEKIRRRSSYVEYQLEGMKLQTDQIGRQIELCDVEISSALVALHDVKNLYEIFRLFQDDAPS